MRNFLASSNWSDTFLKDNETECDVNKMWSSFKSTLHELRDRFVPKVNDSWKVKENMPVPKAISEVIKSKAIAHRRWIASKKLRKSSDVEHKAFKRARNRVKTMLRSLKRKRERDIGENVKGNPKAFWSHVRGKLKTKSGVAPLIDKKDNIKKFSDVDKANILQDQFCSTFTIEPTKNIPRLEKRTNVQIVNMTVTKEIIENEIKRMNVNKACGPDEIPAKMVQELIDHISNPLVEIFRKSLQQGQLPRDWKLAHISAIFKKGNRHEAINYRPISLTSVICKLMETLVKQVLTKHLEENHLLSTKQHGFIKGRSTTTQLLAYLTECADIVASGGVVDAIYFDFAKAFDTVPHQRLLSKLSSYGIGGCLLDWIKSFLLDRRQVVRVNGVESYSCEVKSGVPQGSVLGPLLFVIYINDLPECITSTSYLFADDTKILRKIYSEEDAKQLQHDIDILDTWSKKWLLRFHPDKCHVLTLGKFDNITHTERYKLGETQLEHVFEEKDLGVIFDSEMKFEQHINAKIKKANSMAGLIRRTFSFLDGNLFKRLFTTLVRPHLEYCQNVWSPHLKKRINLIEAVQKRATKLVDGLHNLTYEERLQELNLPTLVFRRLRGDMIELFKHHHSYDEECLSKWFRRRCKPARCHNFPLERNFTSDGVRGVLHNSFYFRAIKTWNELPKDVVDAETLNEFKNRLDEHWNDHPLRYNYEYTQE